MPCAPGPQAKRRRPGTRRSVGWPSRDRPGREGCANRRSCEAAMTATTIDEIGRHAGADVEVRGWVHNLRSSGAIHFLLLRDGTGILQAVAVRQDLAPEVFAAAGALTQESSVIAGGIVRADPRAPGGYELGLRRLTVVQTAEAYPLTPKEHGVEFLMDNRHLWLRSSRPRAIMRVRAEVERA